MNDLLRGKDYYSQYATIGVSGFIQTVRIKTIGQPERVYTKDLREPSLLSIFKRTHVMNDNAKDNTIPKLVIEPATQAILTLMKDIAEGDGILGLSPQALNRYPKARMFDTKEAKTAKNYLKLTDFD